jgi:hypothetical protein
VETAEVRVTIRPEILAGGYAVEVSVNMVAG